MPKCAKFTWVAKRITEYELRYPKSGIRNSKNYRMGLQQQIDTDLNEALRQGDQATLSTLRLLKNSLTAAAKDKKSDLSDEEAVRILQKEAKQRRDSIDSFKQANRQDLVDKEEAELKLIQVYLPKQMSEDELNKIIDAAINESGASGMADMGKVMGIVSKRTAGKADGGHVANLVRQKLQG